MVTLARSLIDAQDQAVAVDRAAEIALQHLPQPLAVLDDEGIVEVIALAQVGERLRVRRPRAEQRAHRIAGRQMHQREDAERDDEQQRDGDRQPHQDQARDARLGSSRRLHDSDRTRRRRAAPCPGGGRAPGSHGPRADRPPARRARRAPARRCRIPGPGRAACSGPARRARSGSASSACRGGTAASGRSRACGTFSSLSGPPTMNSPKSWLQE